MSTPGRVRQARRNPQELSDPLVVDLYRRIEGRERIPGVGLAGALEVLVRPLVPGCPAVVVRDARGAYAHRTRAGAQRGALGRRRRGRGTARYGGGQGA